MIHREILTAPDLARIAAQRLFPANVVVQATDPRETVRDVRPEELASLPHARERRRREFAAGRRAARRAMAQLNRPARPIPAGQDRAPQWPAGIVGCISHTRHVCLAALSAGPEFLAIGIDVEDDLDLPADLIPEVCNLGEIAWLSVQPEHMRGRLARLIFSAKECAYKCQYPVSKALLGFDAFDVTLDLDTGQFEATLTQNVPGFAARTCFSGRFVFDACLIITGMSLPAPQPKTKGV